MIRLRERILAFPWPLASGRRPGADASHRLGPRERVVCISLARINFLRERSLPRFLQIGHECRWIFGCTVEIPPSSFLPTTVCEEFFMFRLVSDFTEAWALEAASTAKLLDALTDASLSTRVDPQGRTLGKIAWHIVETCPEMLPSAGLKLDFHVDIDTVPTRASEIAARYKEGSRLLGQAVAAQWTDAMLAQTTNMYGQEWARGFTLQCLITHQAHHRGQLTILMRQAGLVVPGMVGPAREEWANMGMPAQE